MPSGLGSVLSAGAGIAGALGKGKGSGPTQVSGFASNPDEIKNYLLDVLFPQIKDINASPYQRVPLRRIDSSDLDPVFGSKARQNIQNYKDTLAMIKAASGLVGGAAASDAAGGDMAEDTNPDERYTLPQAYLNTYVPQSMWSQFLKPQVRKSASRALSNMQGGV